jgi:OmpA-OmpF porin, OOP family
MMRLSFIFCCLAFFSELFSQEIIVEGIVVDALKSKGIKAKVQYKSYPTGGITGVLTDSTFSFSIFGSAKYQVTAEAEGYVSRTVMVSPTESINNKIIRTIPLTPKGRAIRLDHLIFDMGRAVINPKSYPGLDDVVTMMKDNNKMEIQLEGHTDNVGNAEKNLALSRERIEAVKNYLVSKGIAKSRVRTKAFGGSQPLSMENTDEAHALNRRVEMRVLKD